MDNITDVTLYNSTDNFTDAVTVLPNVSLSNATSRPAPVRYPRGYYGDTTETLWKVIPPIIMAWGLTGNFLTVMVLLRQLMRKVTSTPMYLMALAFSDSVTLLCGPLRNFIKYVWEDDVRNFTDAGCRIQLYITYASIQLSSWLLVAVTMERVLSVLLPHKVRLGCTPKMAGILIFVIFVCTFGLCICIPVINGIDPVHYNTNCGPTSKKYLEFRDDIWQWIDFCVAYAAPFIVLLVGNIVIIVHLYKSMQRKKKMTTSDVSSSKTTSISVLLVLLCFIFFTTMTPVSVFNIYSPYRYKEILKLPTYKEAWYAYHYLIFQYTVVNLVSYTNAAFNFILYVVSGSKFRNELKQMLCLCFKRKALSGISSSKTKQTTDGKSSSMSGNTSKTMTNGSTQNEQGYSNNAVKYKVEEAHEEENSDKQDEREDNNINNGVENAAFTDVSDENITGKEVNTEAINDHHDDNKAPQVIANETF